MTGVYKGLQNVTGGYKGLRGVTEGYKGLLGFEEKIELELSLDNLTHILAQDSNPTSINTL